MWQMETDGSELILRAAIVYGFVFLLFRWLGKKQLGEISPFDFVLLLIVSESISSGLSGGDTSLAGAMVLAATLLTLNRGIDYIAFKSHRFEKWVDGEPKVIVQNGKIVEKVRKSERITHEELMSALRQQEVEDVSELKFAILETNGKITVIKRDEKS